MWTISVPDLDDDVEHDWLFGRTQGGHLLVIYELPGAITSADVDQVIGVASPLPVETASTLAQIQGVLRQKDVSVSLFKTNLSPESLGHLETCRIESVRATTPYGYHLDQYSNPVVADTLASRFLGDISAVTALLDRGDSHFVVNLFEDNQFYVADPQVETIAEVATAIAPLWEVSYAEML